MFIYFIIYLESKVPKIHIIIYSATFLGTSYGQIVIAVFL